MDFSYFDKVADVTVTVCDKDGVVLYQNEYAKKRDGDVIGRNLYNCHNPKSQEMIRKMLATSTCNNYQTIKHGQRRFIHQTPWYDADGLIAGLIEFGTDIPDDMPVYNRDQKQ